MERTTRVSDQDAEKLDLRFKILGDQPYKCVLSAFKTAGFRRTNKDNWYCFWGFASDDTTKTMNKHQKINHFTGCWHIGRKDKLWLHLSNNKRKFN